MTPLSPIQKSRLAKLLPSELQISSNGNVYRRLFISGWKHESWESIRDTEWPYFIERIKEGMTFDQQCSYSDKVFWIMHNTKNTSLECFATLSEVADALWATLGKEEL